jgi:uncharacterized protein YbjT (DUF2867 family)
MICPRFLEQRPSCPTESLMWLDRQQSAFFLPFGEGKESFIDPRDIAACAVKVLTTSGHDGRIYEITGGEYLRFAQFTEKVSAAIGKQVSYQNIPEAAMRQGILSMGVPAPTADSLSCVFQFGSERQDLSSHVRRR